MSDDERRKASRFGVWFPIQISDDGGMIIAISRDISSVGIAAVAAAKPEVGSQVTVTLNLPNEDEREIKGKIVRVDVNDADPDGLWRHRVAVAFEEELKELEPVLEDLERTSVPPPL